MWKHTIKDIRYLSMVWYSRIKKTEKKKKKKGKGSYTNSNQPQTTASFATSANLRNLQLYTQSRSFVGLFAGWCNERMKHRGTHTKKRTALPKQRVFFLSRTRDAGDAMTLVSVEMGYEVLL